MKSKKELFKWLSLFFQNEAYASLGLKAPGISNETYGRKSCIYVHCTTPGERMNLEGFLMGRGFKVNRDYDFGGSSSEIQVSYFKGVGWNE